MWAVKSYHNPHYLGYLSTHMLISSHPMSWYLPIPWAGIFSYYELISSHSMSWYLHISWCDIFTYHKLTSSILRADIFPYHDVECLVVLPSLILYPFYNLAYQSFNMFRFPLLITWPKYINQFRLILYL